MSQLSNENYHVGWICALKSELAAAKAMLDEEHGIIQEQDSQDKNTYSAGRVHEHNVVIACLPAGEDGVAAAAHSRTTGRHRRSIPDLTREIDIRLGDVVVSQPEKEYGGVVQYDKGKSLAGGHFIRKAFLNRPPSNLLTALQNLQSQHDLEDSKMSIYLTAMIQKRPKMKETGYVYPGADKDHLYSDSGSEIERKPRNDTEPRIHYGTIASGNQVIKDGAVRDRLQKDLGALCVEMEAAGLMNNFPCIIIRGICDYADSHKNDLWQKYAATTAAAFAKELLFHVSRGKTLDEKPIQQFLDALKEHTEVAKTHAQAFNDYSGQQEKRYQSKKEQDCHLAFKTSDYEGQKNINPDRANGTCEWVLKRPQYRKWLDNPYNDLLWISADPGCGKSVLARSLIDHDLWESQAHTVCYFFFKDNGNQDSLAIALCALIHQLLGSQPQLIGHAISSWEKAGNNLQQEVDGLWRILLNAGTDVNAGRTICVLDALDECRENDRKRLINMLATFYMNGSSSASSNGWLKILLTSRPYEEIQDHFQEILRSLPSIRLRGEKENDSLQHEISLVIQGKVDKLASDLKLAAGTKDRLKRKLLATKHRTYLWLQLAIGEIRETYRTSLRPDDEPILTLPATVDDAYEKILARGATRGKENVKRILQIVIGARRPLTVGEMAVALGVATSPPESELRFDIEIDRLQTHICQWCGLFVFINHSRINLIHQTAKEFLLTKNATTAVNNHAWKHSLSMVDVEMSMTHICVRYLAQLILDVDPPKTDSSGSTESIDSDSEVGATADPNELDTFWSYAAEYWAGHLRNIQDETPSFAMDLVLQLYNTKGKRFQRWFSIFWKAKHRFGPQPQMNSIQLAALNRHSGVLQVLMQRDHFDLNAMDEMEGTALMTGSQYDCEKTVRILLQKGADVNAQGGFYGNALQAASFGGDKRLVQLLIENGANVNAQGGFYSNALQAASWGSDEKLIRLLIENGADVNAQGGEYGNALQAASWGGDERVVQLLLGKGADVNAQGGLHGSALAAASKEGHEKIVEMLLEKGADINAQGGLYGSALAAATEKGHEKIIQILLNKGARNSGRKRKLSSAESTPKYAKG
ncbi:MAG: hypothetical protein Q9225_007664 [Loekoesia sp. 1 TL-2023]